MVFESNIQTSRVINFRGFLWLFKTGFSTSRKYHQMMTKNTEEKENTKLIFTKQGECSQFISRSGGCRWPQIISPIRAGWQHDNILIILLIIIVTLKCFIFPVCTWSVKAIVASPIPVPCTLYKTGISTSVVEQLYLVIRTIPTFPALAEEGIFEPSTWVVEVIGAWPEVCRGTVPGQQQSNLAPPPHLHCPLHFNTGKYTLQQLRNMVCRNWEIWLTETGKYG